MKRFINILILLCITVLSKAQNITFTTSCLNDVITQLANDNNSAITANANCGNTSPYYSNNSLYLPQSSDEVIYIKLNFIFLIKPDGTGNFEQNNPEHIQVVDDMIDILNYRLANLGTPVVGCEGYGNNNMTTTKFQAIVNKIWKVDPAWDYLQTGYVPSCGNPEECPSNQMLYPPNHSLYYYNYLDSDASIPTGINIVFSNNGYVYNEYVNNQNFSATGNQGWAAAEFPRSGSQLNDPLRQFYPDYFNVWLWLKNHAANNPDIPWLSLRNLYLQKGYAFVHELGHNFGLSHHDCSANLMSYNQDPPKTYDYLSNNDISTMYRMASVSNARQYISNASFKNTSINLTNNQTWDLNFRLYSNVKIDNNSSLKATCKIIMAPDSRFIVRNGSNFIIEAAEISSANNSTWNGIKVEGNGYLLINPNTLIDTNHFYAYADNNIFTTGEMSDISSKKTTRDLAENAVLEKNYKIYPNPTGDFINIETTNKISKVEVYNLVNKSFLTNYKDNKVDVRSLPQGNYILKIYVGSEVKTVHFIKK